MKTFSLWIAVLAISLIVIGCGDRGYEGAEPDLAGQTEAVMVMPVTTTSDEARQEFMSGMYALDVGRAIDARAHFENAVEADTAFASAYLYLANTANSLAEFTTSLERAEAAAGAASREEQLLIEITRKGFDSDLEGQLAAAQELTELAPESPRAWLALAGVQTILNRHAEARPSIGRAIELAPTMAAAHLQLANSYLFGEPRDLAQAEQHARHSIEHAPNEATPYDLLGDVHRAQGELEKARDAYTEAARYSGDDGSPYQQRAHVNSFLGDYDAARADYDQSISMARANQAPAYGVYRAYVNVHAGDPAAAISELKTLAAGIDGMNIPDPTGLKIFALQSAAVIATHHRMIDEAEALVAQTAALMRSQAEKVGTDQFTRNQNANIAYLEGRLAIAKGDFNTAAGKADEIATLVEPDANPRKMEPVHELRGLAALEQDQFSEAVEHLRQGDHQNNIYIRYQLAAALEGAGQADEARTLYNEVANWNFNDVGGALTRKAAMEKAAMTL